MSFQEFEVLGTGAGRRAGAEHVAVAQENDPGIGLAKFGGRRRQRVEHALQIEGGTADDFQYVAGCGLLLKGFAEITRPCLNLLEEPRVLDRDYRLVCEGTQ